MEDEKRLDMITFLKIFCKLDNNKNEALVKEFANMLKCIVKYAKYEEGDLVIEIKENSLKIELDPTESGCKEFLYCHHRTHKIKKDKSDKSSKNNRSRQTNSEKIRQKICASLLENNFEWTNSVIIKLQKYNKKLPLNQEQRDFIIDFKKYGFCGKSKQEFKTFLDSHYDENSYDYYETAWIFAFLCFPKEEDEKKILINDKLEPVNRHDRSYVLKEVLKKQNSFNSIKDEIIPSDKEVNNDKHYSRTDFADTASPYFPCIEKNTTIVRDLTDGSNDHGKINESNIGRDDLLEEIAEQLHKGNIGNHVALYGLGGIGKTFICRKIIWNYREKYTDGIEYVAWVKYENNLENSLYNTFVRNNIYKPDEYSTKDDFLLQFDYDPLIKEMHSQLNQYSEKERKTSIIREAFNNLGRRLLIVIDNANSITGEEINWLNHCTFRIILTTRSKIEEFHSIYVEGPTTDYCCDLYKIKAEKSASILSDEENSCIRKIIKLADCHTLTIELIAKTQLNSGISEKEMLDRLKQSGFSLTGISDTIENNGESKILIEHLSKLFDISDIENDESKIRIMRYFSLLEPHTAIRANTVKKWFWLDNLNDVNALIKLGWLSRSENNYTIHPVISDVVRHKYPPDFVYSEPFIKGMIEHGIDDVHLFHESVKHYAAVAKRFQSIKDDKYGGLLLITAFNLQISGQPNKAIAFYDAILKIYKDEPIETDDEKASFAFIEALRYDCLEKNTEAIKHYKAAIELGERVLKDNYILKAKLYELMANDYVSLSDFKSALANFNKVLMVYKEANEENSINAGYCHLNIAMILLSLNESDEARKHMDIGVKILENDTTDIAKNYIDFYKSLSCYIQEDYKKAQTYLDFAITPDSFFSMFPLFYSKLTPLIADIYVKSEEFNKAIEFAEKSLESSKDGKQIPPFHIINIYLKLAKIYYQQGNNELFMENYNQAVSIWQKNGNQTNFNDVYVRNTIINIVKIALSFSDNCDYPNALSWYNSVAPYVDIYPEFTIELFLIIAQYLYHTSDLKNLKIYLNTIIELGEKYSLQNNENVLEAKKIIENLIQGTIPSTSEEARLT